MPFNLVKKELTRDNMLYIFDNFHLEVEEEPLRNEKDYVRLAKESKKECVDVEIVF